MYDSFSFFKEQLPEEWEKGQADQGLLTNNTGVYALIHCFSDILEFLQSKGQIDTKKSSLSELVDACTPYYSAIAEFYNNMDADMIDRIRNNYGGNGARDHWRFMQKGIHEEFPFFNPEGLEAWWDDNSGARNEPASNRLKAIDARVHELTKNGLQEIYGDKWEDSLPDSLIVKYATEIAKSQKRHNSDPAIPAKTYWDCITLADCKVIALDGSNWSTWFKDKFTKPGTARARKDEVTYWIDDMHKMLRELQKATGKSISINEYDQICTIVDWLCPDIEFDDVESAQ